MERLYAVIEIATGKLALGKAYYTEVDKDGKWTKVTAE